MTQKNGLTIFQFTRYLSWEPGLVKEGLWDMGYAPAVLLFIIIIVMYSAITGSKVDVHEYD